MHPADSHDQIRVRGARVNNLQDVDVDIPKRRMTVFTGVSGSGKSSLVFGTIAAESQRLINETYPAFVQSFMASPARPDVDLLENLSAAIVVDQERMAANSRSTVGTATDVNSLLRIVWSRLATPHVGPSYHFSFNVPDGMCPHCEGVGKVSAIDESLVIDTSLSLNEGAIKVPGYGVGTWQWRGYGEDPRLDPDVPVRDLNDEQLHWLLHEPGTRVKKFGINTTHEGLLVRVRRQFLNPEKEPGQKHMKDYAAKIATFGDCPECGGTRLKEASRTASIDGVTLPQALSWQITDLRDWIVALASQEVSAKAGPVLANLTAQLDSLVEVGLGYLALDRESGTLSGGEAQRVKISAPLSPTSPTSSTNPPSVSIHTTSTAWLGSSSASGTRATPCWWWNTSHR